MLYGERLSGRYRQVDSRLRGGRIAVYFNNNKEIGVHKQRRTQFNANVRVYTHHAATNYMYLGLHIHTAYNKLDDVILMCVPQCLRYLLIAVVRAKTIARSKGSSLDL